jgi:hypothetical protein
LLPPPPPPPSWPPPPGWGEIVKSQCQSTFVTQGHYTWDFSEFVPVEPLQRHWRDCRQHCFHCQNGHPRRKGPSQTSVEKF